MPLTDDEKRTVLEAALHSAPMWLGLEEHKYEEDLAWDLAKDLLPALSALGYDITTIEHDWTGRPSVRGERCKGCGLVRSEARAGGQHLGYTFYRGNSYAGDDMPGVTPPCVRKASKK